MDKILVWLADSSIIAGFIILIVLLLRPFIKKVPKRVNLVLWLVVAVRLVMPFGLTSSFSLVPDIEGLRSSYSSYLTDKAEKESVVQRDAAEDSDSTASASDSVETDGDSVETVGKPMEVAGDPASAVSEPGDTGLVPLTTIHERGDTGSNPVEAVSESLEATGDPAVAASKPVEAVGDPIAAVRESGNAAVKPETDRDSSSETMNNLVPILFVIWISGCGIMLLYFTFSIIRIRRRTRISVPADIPLELKMQSIAPVYICEDIDSPFIIGLFKPRMYVPEGMNAQALAYVIRHENAHIRHFDQFWKLFGFLLLTIYWFNPLAWIAFICFTKDLELACDERAVGKLSSEDRAAYSEALLSCSLRNRMLTVCPVAFGETGVKERVKAVISMKKPLKVVVVGAILGCILFTGCFLTNPASAMKEEAVENESVSPFGSGDEEKNPVAGTVNKDTDRTEDDPDVIRDASDENKDLDDDIKDDKTIDPTVDGENGEQTNAFDDKTPDNTTETKSDNTLGKSDTPENPTQLDIENTDSDTKATDDKIPVAQDAETEAAPKTEDSGVNGTENPGVPSTENAVIPTGVIRINDYAFKGEKGIISVSIPDTVEVIGTEAFAECTNLSSVYLPASIKEIGHGAFTFSNLTSINIPESVTKIGNNAFGGCKLSTVSVPDTVSIMEAGVFYYNTALKYCRLPSGLTEIPDYIFYKNTSLSEVVFNRNITRIGNNAFSECTSLKYFDIPETVTDIGYAAFCGSGIKEIRIPEGVTVIKESTFSNCTDLERVYLPKSLTRIKDYAFMNCTNLKEINIPESVKEIETYSFSKCTSLSDESRAAIKAVNKKAKVK